MANVHELITSIVGQLAWSAKSGIGSFITIEFGDPNLEVREPITAKQSASPKVAELLRRRHVVPIGTWHLWVQEAIWSITAGENKCVFNDDRDLVDEVLRKIDGQRVLAVDFTEGKPGFVIKFDLGGELIISTAPGQLEADTTAWSLHRWGGPTVSVFQTGNFSVEQHAQASL